MHFKVLLFVTAIFMFFAQFIAATPVLPSDLEQPSSDDQKYLVRYSLLIILQLSFFSIWEFVVKEKNISRKFHYSSSWNWRIGEILFFLIIIHLFLFFQTPCRTNLMLFWKQSVKNLAYVSIIIMPEKLIRFLFNSNNICAMTRHFIFTDWKTNNVSIKSACYTHNNN